VCANWPFIHSLGRDWAHTPSTTDSIFLSAHQTSVFFPFHSSAASQEGLPPLESGGGAVLNSAQADNLRIIGTYLIMCSSFCWSLIRKGALICRLPIHHHVRCWVRTGGGGGRGEAKWRPVMGLIKLKYFNTSLFFYSSFLTLNKSFCSSFFFDFICLPSFFY
jgi:hypothetical protein